MSARLRNAVVVMGAFCFPYAVASAPSNGDTIPAAMAVCATQSGTLGLANWYRFMQHYGRGLPAPNPCDEASAPIDDESLPEMPAIRVPSAATSSLDSDRAAQNGWSERQDEPSAVILFAGSIDSLDENQETAGDADTTHDEAAGDATASEPEQDTCPDEADSTELETPNADATEEDDAIDGIFAPFESPSDLARREAIWI